MMLCAKKAGQSGMDMFMGLELCVQYPVNSVELVLLAAQSGASPEAWYDMASQLAAVRDLEGAATGRGMLDVYTKVLESPGGIASAVLSGLQDPSCLASEAWRQKHLQPVRAQPAGRPNLSAQLGVGQVRVVAHVPQNEAQDVQEQRNRPAQRPAARNDAAFQSDTMKRPECMPAHHSGGQAIDDTPVAQHHEARVRQQQQKQQQFEEQRHRPAMSSGSHQVTMQQQQQRQISAPSPGQRQQQQVLAGSQSNALVVECASADAPEYEMAEHEDDHFMEESSEKVFTGEVFQQQAHQEQGTIIRPDRAGGDPHRGMRQLTAALPAKTGKATVKTKASVSASAPARSLSALEAALQSPEIRRPATDVKARRPAGSHQAAQAQMSALYPKAKACWDRAAKGQSSMSRQDFKGFIAQWVGAAEEEEKGAGDDLLEDMLAESAVCKSKAVFCLEDFFDFLCEQQNEDGSTAASTCSTIVSSSCPVGHKNAGEMQGGAGQEQSGSVTLKGKVVRKHEVSKEGQNKKYFLIMESDVNKPDVYVPRNIFTGWDLQMYHDQVHKNDTLVVKAERHEQGSNKWRAITFLEHFPRNSSQKESNISKRKSGPGPVRGVSNAASCTFHTHAPSSDNAAGVGMPFFQQGPGVGRGVSGAASGTSPMLSPFQSDAAKGGTPVPMLSPSHSSGVEAASASGDMTGNTVPSDTQYPVRATSPASVAFQTSTDSLHPAKRNNLEALAAQNAQAKMTPVHSASPPTPAWNLAYPTSAAPVTPAAVDMIGKTAVGGQSRLAAQTPVDGASKTAAEGQPLSAAKAAGVAMLGGGGGGLRKRKWSSMEALKSLAKKKAQGKIVVPKSAASKRVMNSPIKEGEPRKAEDSFVVVRKRSRVGTAGRRDDEVESRVINDRSTGWGCQSVRQEVMDKVARESAKKNGNFIRRDGQNSKEEDNRELASDRSENAICRKADTDPQEDQDEDFEIDGGQKLTSEGEDEEDVLAADLQLELAQMDDEQGVSEECRGGSAGEGVEGLEEEMLNAMSEDEGCDDVGHSVAVGDETSAGKGENSAVTVEGVRQNTLQSNFADAQEGLPAVGRHADVLSEGPKRKSGVHAAGQSGSEKPTNRGVEKDVELSGSTCSGGTEGYEGCVRKESQGKGVDHAANTGQKDVGRKRKEGGTARRKGRADGGEGGGRCAG